MKTKIIVGAVLLTLVAGLVIANLGIANFTDTVTRVKANSDSCWMRSEVIQMNPPGSNLYPKYQGLAYHVIVAKPDTSMYGTTADGYPMARDSAKVIIKANIGGYVWPVYSQTITTSLPDTVNGYIADTGLARILFSADNCYIDAYSVDTSGAGAADTFVHSFYYYVRLIEKADK